MSSYESVKSSIRLLLSSASKGLTLEQLNSDYQYYNQSKDIPYAHFGYSTLLNFLSDMNDIAQFDWNNPYPIIHCVRTNEKLRLNRTLKLTKKSLNRNVKRLALNHLSDITRQSNISTEHVIRQLTNLTMNPKSSENFSTNQMFTISIDLTDHCEIVRYTNGKYFIPCFELARILQRNENYLDRETMLSRIRIYQSNELFSQLILINQSCLHSNHHHRPYFFLFLISSILPLLKTTKNLPQFSSIVHAFEQFI